MKIYDVFTDDLDYALAIYKQLLMRISYFS